MTKYNVRDFKETATSYQDTISPDVLDVLYTKILNVLLVEKKFMLKDYSAKMLAKDLNTNSRYISAVCNIRFHMNYATLVNKYRVEEAMSILVDRRYIHLKMEDVCDMVGFANRQSFYAAFFKQKGCTPRDYRMNYIKMHPEFMKKTVSEEMRRKRKLQRELKKQELKKQK